MSPSGAVPSLRADAARNRRVVLDVAREALRAGGLQVNMNQLAKRAGVGVGTVYRHFPTRQALVEELVQERFLQLLQDARSALAEEPEQALERFVRAALAVELDEPGMAEVLAATSDATPSTIEVKAELLETVDAILDHARAAGRARADITADDLRRLVCGVEHALRSGSGDPRDALERYVAVLLAGLRPT